MLPLRKADLPSAALDHHVSGAVVTMLMKDDAVMERMEALAEGEGEFGHEDPMQIIRTLLCAS